MVVGSLSRYRVSSQYAAVEIEVLRLTLQFCKLNLRLLAEVSWRWAVSLQTESSSMNDRCPWSRALANLLVGMLQYSQQNVR